jgi:PfaB family protein
MSDGKIAIIGMEAIFGADEGLDAFDRNVFDGLQHSAQAPPDRQKRIRAGRRSERKESYIRLLGDMNRPSASELLQIVADGAQRNTTSSKKQEDLWSDLGFITLSERGLQGFQPRAKTSLNEDSMPRALQTAQDLLANKEVKGVLIAAVHLMNYSENTSAASPGQEQNIPDDPPDSEPCTNGLFPGEGAAAILVKEVAQARLDQDRIYAIIDAIALESNTSPSENHPSRQQITDVCKRGFDIAGVRSTEIGYLEVVRKGVEEDGTAIDGLTQGYQAGVQGLACALGSSNAKIPHTSPASGLASLIKTALCLYHRYIPAGPGWTGPKDEKLWKKSPFYTATESRPWFVDPACPRRTAAISHVDSRGTAHLVLYEDTIQDRRPNRYLAMVSPYCYPLSGDDQTDLVKGLTALCQTTKSNSNLLGPAKESLAAFQERPEAAYALTIVGHTREEILKEIEFMQKRLSDAFERGTELKTPKGSYFTPNPLGGDQTVAFVYPGVGSAYVGLGQDLFHLFPAVFEKVSGMTEDAGEFFKEREIYPRSREILTGDDKWKLELRFRKDTTTIAKCGLSFFGLYTMVLRDCFKVTPHYALGYCQGETGMMASLGVWTDPMKLTETHTTSPTFQERLHGELTAVREYWGLKGRASSTDEKIWDSYTLQAAPAIVREAIEKEERVYLTMVNTPDEVVIAGEPESCLRVIKELGCKHYPLGLRMALHADPARLEYDRLVDLYTLPVNENPGIRFYSTSCYKPIPIRSKAVAHSIAKAFSQTVDFPRLVSQTYEDGARIFIEIGSRKFCSNLIDKILTDRPHLAIPTNVKGVKEQASLVRILAQLLSHRVPVDLSPLF